MCWARPARLVRRESRAAPGRRATAPARPVNNKGQQDQSAADNPNGAGADAGPTPSPVPPRQTSRRPAVPADDRLTTILPPVRDDAPNRFRDPIEAVKAALDGRPSSRTSELRAPLEMATAALEARSPTPRRQPAGGGGGGGRPPGPPGPRRRTPPLPDWGWVQRLDWTW